MTVSGGRVFVPNTGEWWEPTDDPNYYRTVEFCDDCHHPVHGFEQVREPRRHLADADWILRCAVDE